MNTAIIYAGKSRESEKEEKISRALAKGLEGQGHMVRLLNAYLDTDARLSSYDFIIVVTEANGILSSKIPDQVRKYLREVPGAGGKRCIAVITAGIRSNAALQNLMKIMESEGMFLTLSEVITKESDAELRGKHFRLERR